MEVYDQRLTAPLNVDFNITSRCNLKCKFCYAAADEVIHKDKEMSLDEIDRLFEEFNRMNVHVVRISGGEPFVRKDIQEIIKLTDKYNFTVCMNTNATLLTDEDIEVIKNSKVVVLGVSLDGYNKEIHENVRGVSGSFDKTVNNIKKLVKSCGDKLATTYTLTAINCDINMVENVIKFNESLGVKAIGFQLVAPVGRCAEEVKIAPSYEQWKKLFIWLTEYKLKHKGISISVNPTNEAPVYWEYYLPLKEENKLHLLKEVWGQDYEYEFNNKNISCTAGYYTIAIAGNGDVYPCELMMTNNELCIGNALEEDFRKIFRESPLLNKLHNMRIQELEGKCSDCELKFCGGGCRASAYATSGNINGIDPRCPISSIDIVKEG